MSHVTCSVLNRKANNTENNINHIEKKTEKLCLNTKLKLFIVCPSPIHWLGSTFTSQRHNWSEIFNQVRWNLNYHILFFPKKDLNRRVWLTGGLERGQQDNAAPPMCLARRPEEREPLWPGLRARCCGSYPSPIICLKKAVQTQGTYEKNLIFWCVGKKETNRKGTKVPAPTSPPPLTLALQWNPSMGAGICLLKLVVASCKQVLLALPGP